MGELRQVIVIVFLAVLVFLISFSMCSSASAQQPVISIVLRTDPPTQSVKFWINSTEYFTNASGIVQVSTKPGIYSIGTEGNITEGDSVLLNFSKWSNGNASTQLTMPLSSDLDLTAQFEVKYGIHISATPSPTVLAPGILQGPEWVTANHMITVYWPYIWNAVSNQERTSLVSYTLDGFQTPVDQRNSGGVFQFQLKADRPHNVVFNGVQQFLVTAQGGNNVNLNPSSPTHDSWFDSGTTVSVATDYSWDIVTGKSRKNLVSWNIQGSASQGIMRASNGRFEISVLVDSSKTVQFNWVTQFYLDVSGGANVNLAPVTPTGDEWYDEGSTVVVSTYYVWGVLPNQQRMNLIGIAIDGADKSVDRAGAGMYSTNAILMDKYHTIVFEAGKQFYVTATTEISSVKQSASQTNDSWYDANSFITIRVYTPYRLSDQHRFIFVQWTSLASAPTFNAASPIASIQVTGPMILKAKWVEQWLVGLSYSPSDFPLSSSEFWAENDKTISIPDNQTVYMNSTVRFVFREWSADSQFGTGTNIVITPVSPILIHVQYVKQYLVSISSEGLPPGIYPGLSLTLSNGTVIHGVTPFQLWIDARSTLKLSFDNFVWTGLLLAYMIAVNSASPMTVNGPLKIIATYSYLDRVTIIVAVLTILSIENIVLVVRYVKRRTSKVLQKIPIKKLSKM